MTATNHGVAGGIFGAFLPLELAIPLAFVSHFVLDILPHYGIPERIKSRSSNYRNFVLYDTLLGLILALLMALFHKWHMFIAAWVAYGPDATLVVYYYMQGKNNLNIKGRNWFMRFHRRIQFEVIWGKYIELTLFVVMLPVFMYELIK